MEVSRSARATFHIDEFLNRPLVAHLATVAPQGPRDNPVWYLWEDESIWIIAERDVNTFQDRVGRNPNVAVGIVDFDPGCGKMQHVGIRGRAQVLAWDKGRADRLFARYYTHLKGYRDYSDDASATGSNGLPSRFVFVRVQPITAVARDSEYRKEVLGIVD